MSRRAPKRPRNPPPQWPSPPAGEALLDAFTIEEFDHWTSRAADVRRCASHLYFETERQRVDNHDWLLEALRGAGGIAVPLAPPWVRITDYRWSLQPLLPAGSLKTIGGRFNIGDAASLRPTVPGLVYCEQ